MSDEKNNENEEVQTRTRSSTSSAYMRRVGGVELNAVNCYQNDMEAGTVKVIRGPKDNKEEIERPAKWAVTSTPIAEDSTPTGDATVLSAFATKAEAIEFLRSHEKDLKAAASEEE
tara:strand:+ start:852 stop:1199 length:348 start_codon:yes stop_codon:yes gene_type:complete